MIDCICRSGHRVAVTDVIGCCCRDGLGVSVPNRICGVVASVVIMDHDYLPLAVLNCRWLC